MANRRLSRTRQSFRLNSRDFTLACAKDLADPNAPTYRATVVTLPSVSASGSTPQEAFVKCRAALEASLANNTPPPQAS